jgi:hypothetical protein
MVTAALAIGRVRPWLADHYHALRHVDDVYALPTPEQTVSISLGYRSALADLIYANTLVAYGIHSQENRRFEFVGNYLDTCIALDPTMREVYYYADTLLTLQPVAPTYSDHVWARRIQERGRKEFPYDAELWLVTGQYLAYLAPGQIKDRAVRKEWRTEGARVMARACELAAGDQAITRRCVAAARTLTRAGERKALIRFLERVLALSDDEETRWRAQFWLAKQRDAAESDALAQRQVRLDDLRQRDLPFVSPELFVLLGPPFAAGSCVGRAYDATCATTWKAWIEAASDNPLE